MFDPESLETWSVLVVDDEPDNLELISECLAFLGVKVMTATDGMNGLEILKGFAPHLILLDLSMPRMNGWEMRKRIKTDQRLNHVYIVALTAHAMVNDRERALDVGFDGYITKPISVQTFADQLRTIMKQAGART